MQIRLSAHGRYAEFQELISSSSSWNLGSDRQCHGRKPMGIYRRPRSDGPTDIKI